MKLNHWLLDSNNSIKPLTVCGMVNNLVKFESNYNSFIPQYGFQMWVKLQPFYLSLHVLNGTTTETVSFRLTSAYLMVITNTQELGLLS